MDNNNFHVVTVPEVGRCLVASRPIPALGVILWDQAAVVGPHHDTGPVCVGCMGHQVGHYCVGCGWPVCGTQCSERDTHRRQECHLLARLSKETNIWQYEVVAVLRLLLLREEDELVWDQIDLLMDHDRPRRENIQEWKMFQTMVVDVIKKIKPDCEDDLIHRLIGIINVNSVSFNCKEERRRGRALYPLLSLASHSCISNSRYSVNPEDFSVCLRARRDIEEGEEITVSYVPALYGSPKRRNLLEEDWYFQCRCPRCCDVSEFGTFLSALQCSSCREGLILPETLDKDSLWRCRFCSNPFEAEFIHELVTRLEDELDTVCSSPDCSVSDIEAFIKKNAVNLYSKHYINLIAQKHIVRILDSKPTVTRQEARKCVRLCKSLQGIISRIDPGLSHYLGVLIRTMTKAQLQLLKMDLQDKKVSKNSYLEESEQVWERMKEVEQCEILCTPVNYSDFSDQG